MRLMPRRRARFASANGLGIVTHKIQSSEGATQTM